MQKVSLSLTAALMIVSGVIGIGTGYWLTPNYTLSMYEKNTMDLGQPDKWVDLRYLEAMIAHHQETMLLGRQFQSGARPELKSFAVELLKSEPPAITELYRYKKEWYHDSRTVREPQVAHLGSWNKTFDLRFLNALIAHHERGIKMAMEIRMKSSRSEILDHANHTEHLLQSDLQKLRSWREAWYGVMDTTAMP